MDLDIKDLGTTLIVGAFTILGLEAVFHFFLNKQLTGFFQDPLGFGRPGRRESGHGASKNPELEKNEEIKINPMKATVFVGIAFAIGMVAEDLSYKFVDNVQTPFKTLPAKITSVLPDELNNRLSLPSKENSRVRTLIKNKGEKLCIEPLAIDLAKNGAFHKLNSDIGERIESWLKQANEGDRCLNSRAGLSEEQIEESIYSLYYYAKNSVYTVENYYDEMKKIESRRDFSRSIALIACIYLIVALIVGVLRIALMFGKVTPNDQILEIKRKRYGNVRSIWPQFWNNTKEYHSLKTHRWRVYAKVLSVALVFFCIYFGGMWAYERESDEFNKRAFGYYSSMLFTENHNSKKAP